MIRKAEALDTVQTLGLARSEFAGEALLRCRLAPFLPL